ncbi:parathyroid hormone/parathyroid hormone-related peptide receptor-like isoform X1 [Saccostrea cucullata]|uniref:parathyroid hormone/parathyroid hormone-related peptide receptor-like isoform X1 n=1 Tax=Saccostrea cuccullata TaxID=36930 RepID=UPI002ED052EF
MTAWCFGFSLFLVLFLARVKGNIVVVSLEEQTKLLNDAMHRCLIYILDSQTNSSFQNASETSSCSATWDSLACWPQTKAGETAIIPCPNYLNSFDSSAKAYRNCTENGTWLFIPKLNSTWSDYRACVIPDPGVTVVPKLIQDHMDSITMMYTIGYGVSLVSLLLATVIMLMFRKLRCPRTTIHVNLFASFMIRAAFSFMKENLLVSGVGFSGDVIETANGHVEFKSEGTHWQCKLFFTIFYYFLGANYMWILVEGLYLHLLVSVTVFSERSGVKWLVLFGWGSQLLCVVPWVIVRATLEDVLCWNTHPSPGYFWILRGPIVASVVVNFVIFINIIRILFTKLNAFNANETKKFRYKKLAKATLVLIPLFGVHYVVFIGLPDRVSDEAELVKLYFEMFFNSFQGFIVALIFCFFNGEVQAEIKKKWRRFLISRGQGLSRKSTRETMTSFMSHTRGGSLGSTTNSQDSKEHQNGNCTRETSLIGYHEELHPLQKNKVYVKENGVYQHQNGKQDECKPLSPDQLNASC